MGPRAIAAAALVGLSSCSEMSARTPICGEVGAALSLLPTQCGPTLDLTPINDYHGEIAAVQDREDAVALIGGDCTGTLIAAQAGAVVLSAGHCVPVGGRVQVAFNVEAHPDGDELVTDGTVIEQSSDPDYALIELPPSRRRRSPRGRAISSRSSSIRAAGPRSSPRAGSPPNAMGSSSTRISTRSSAARARASSPATASSSASTPTEIARRTAAARTSARRRRASSRRPPICRTATSPIVR